jgi:pimeloyl-ACP methyl ester carboxylesterase
MRNSLTEGSIWKSMLIFAFPVLLSNLLQLFYDTFDAWTVGHFLGDSALAAVTSSSSLIFLLVGFCNGLSMGAGTVMIAAGAPDLPDNVIGVLADCGYSSPKDIIQKVIRDMKLPPTLSYPFVKLGARIFGHFDLEETSPVEALKNSKVPVLLIHGEDDNFVPCDMSRKCYESCTSKKRLVTIPGAGHGLSYPTDPKRYLTALQEFFS